MNRGLFWSGSAVVLMLMGAIFATAFNPVNRSTAAPGPKIDSLAVEGGVVVKQTAGDVEGLILSRTGTGLTGNDDIRADADEVRASITSGELGLVNFINATDIRIGSRTVFQSPLPVSGSFRHSPEGISVELAGNPESYVKFWVKKLPARIKVISPEGITVWTRYQAESSLFRVHTVEGSMEIKIYY